VIQKYCPFLFELPGKALYFCAIHNVKPMTCRAYTLEECLKSHPDMARRRVG
jgi:Fe-S-cluster containining protein